MMETDDTIQAVKKNSNPGENKKNKEHRKEIEPLITTLEEGTILNYNYVLPTDGVEEYYLTVLGTAGWVIIPCSDISNQLNNGLAKNNRETKTENEKNETERSKLVREAEHGIQKETKWECIEVVENAENDLEAEKNTSKTEKTELQDNSIVDSELHEEVELVI